MSEMNIRNFRYFQGENGAIYLSLNNNSVELQLAQIEGLMLPVDELGGLDLEKFKNFYEIG